MESINYDNLIDSLFMMIGVATLTVVVGSLILRWIELPPESKPVDPTMTPPDKP